MSIDDFMMKYPAQLEDGSIRPSPPPRTPGAMLEALELIGATVVEEGHSHGCASTRRVQRCLCLNGIVYALAASALGWDS